MKNRLIQAIFVLFFFCTGTSYGQNMLYGELVSAKDKSPVEDGYVVLKQSGQTVKIGSSDIKGEYKIIDIPSGKYAVEVICMGYKTVYDSLDIVESCNRVYALEEDVELLDELTVVADRSQVVKRTANGQVFFLSSSAKKMSNPFVALQEIPAIISDANTSSVKMLNGEAPLILINGNAVNSGISPISPSDIESVEVVNSASARYQQDGVTSIINIKLKPHAKPYVWLEAATRHEIPLGKGFGVGYFEVGNHKVSLYGRAAYNYTYHDDTDSEVSRSNTGYTQNYNETARNDADKWIGELLLKYLITDKDYFAVHLYDSYDLTKQQSNANGDYTGNVLQEYSYDFRGKNKSNILTSSMYYKHSFSQNNDLELRLAYNYNKNDYDASRAEYYDRQPDNTDVRYHNKRHSGSLHIDYSKVFENDGSLIAGSHSSLIADDIDNVVGANPLFKHTNYNQYLYIGYGGAYKKIYYNASVGLEGIWAKAGDTDYSYFRPRGNVSATWTADSHNSVRFSYNLTNQAPNVAYLNPYNTSTDPMIVSVGNPNLKPQMIHNFTLSYTFNVGNLYLTPEAGYKYVYDMIENYGYNEGDIYYSTYINAGHYSRAYAGANASYRFKWGRIYAGGGWTSDYFMGQSSKNSGYASFGFNARAKNFSFYGDIEYNSRSYSALSSTVYNRPSMANLQVNYNFTPDFYIGVCLQHFTGEYSTKTTTIDGTYRSVFNTRFKDKSFRPWVMLRYTFRMNADKKHKLGKVLNSTEEGVSIIK